MHIRNQGCRGATMAIDVDFGSAVLYERHTYIVVNHDCKDVRRLSGKSCLVNLKTGGIRFIGQSDYVEKVKAHVEIE